MKVLLLQPPVRDYYETRLRQLPLGLCYLKAALKKHVPEARVRVLDLRCGHGTRPAPLPAELSYLADYFTHPDASPFGGFSRFRHFGADDRLAAALIRREKPDLVGISSLFSPYFREALDLARVAKEACGAPVFLGGTHATAAPESLLASPFVDGVVLGEGERPLADLVRTLQKGGDLFSVPNLALRSPEGIVRTETAPNFPFDSLPVPDFSDLSQTAYRLGKRPLAFVQATRGCPMGCSFCTVSGVFGKAWRPRNISSVLEEIRLRASQGYRAVDFEDDNLNLDPEYFSELLLSLEREFSGSGMVFCAMNGLSGRDLSPALITLMKRAGFFSLNLPLVTADDERGKELKRPVNREGFRSTALAAFEEGLSVTAYQILGLPGEEAEAMLDTLALLSGLPVMAGLSIFYSSPGCPMAEPGMTEADFVRARSTALGPDPDRREDLYTLFLTGRIVNFIKGLNPATKTQSLGDALLRTRNLAPRKREGAELLLSLLDGRGLHALSPHGPIRLTRFNEKLFFRFLQKTAEIKTLSGKGIRVGR